MFDLISRIFDHDAKTVIPTPNKKECYCLCPDIKCEKHASTVRAAEALLDGTKDNIDTWVTADVIMARRIAEEYMKLVK